MDVTVMSRREIAAVDRVLTPHVVVSISDPVMPGYPGDPRSGTAKVPENALAVLRLRFWDADPEALERNFHEWEEHEAEAWNVPACRAFVDQQIALSMTAAHAEEIRDFLLAHDGADLLVHCEAGISRSAGVAAGLVASDPRYRWINETQWRFRPNAHVKSLIVRAYRRAA